MFNQNSSYIKLLKKHWDSSLLLSSLPPPPHLGKVMWSLYHSLSYSHGCFMMWSEEKWGRLLSRSKKIRTLICINKVKVMLMGRIWISILDPPRPSFRRKWVFVLVDTSGFASPQRSVGEGRCGIADWKKDSHLPSLLLTPSLAFPSLGQTSIAWVKAQLSPL